MNVFRAVLFSFPVLLIATPVWAKEGPDVNALLQQNGCMACHSVTDKLVGPSFKQVAERYRGKKGATGMLAKKIVKGGNGNWNDLTGGMMMPPHPDISPADSKAIARWVLSQK